jgi:hypothetical protein
VAAPGAEALSGTAEAARARAAARSRSPPPAAAPAAAPPRAGFSGGSRGDGGGDGEGGGDEEGAGAAVPGAGFFHEGAEGGEGGSDPLAATYGGDIEVAGLGDAAPRPLLTLQSPPPRRSVPPMHTSLTLADRSAPEPEPVVPPGGKAAPGGGALGSFMYLKNSRFDPAAPSPDNPVYWVGRVAEIMRGGRVRLHWHRETALGSGAYVSTNNYFPERAALLQSFRAVVWEPAAKAWRTYPALERATAEEAAVAAARAAKGQARGGGAAASTPAAPAALSIGAFVFLRNARFKPGAESPIMPRYWVARVTGITVQEPPLAAAPSGEVALVNGSPVALAPPGEGTARATAVLTTPDGRLRLQWHREAALGTGVYVPTNHIFFEQRRLVQLVPGAMRFDSRAQAWVRKALGEEASAAPPPPLLFEGDEHIAPGAAGGGEAGAGAPAGAGASPPLEPGAFAFIANSKYAPGTPETAAVPRYWVARIMGLVPPQPGMPPAAKVQWHMEVAPGARVFRQTPRTFMEAVSALRPLPDMAFDASASAWRLMGAYNEGGRFAEVAGGPALGAAAALSPAPPPPPQQQQQLLPLRSSLKLVVRGARGLVREDGAPVRLAYALLRLRGFPPLVTAAGEESRGHSSDGGAGEAGEAGSAAPPLSSWLFAPQVAAWLLPPAAGATRSTSPGKAAVVPNTLVVEFWDAGAGGAVTDDPALAGHAPLGKAVIDLSRPLMHVPGPAREEGEEEEGGAPSAGVGDLSPLDTDIVSALAPRRVLLLSDVGALTKLVELRLWIEDEDGR